MGTKSFVQIENNAVFTTTSGKMQFRSGVFDHFKFIDDRSESIDLKGECNCGYGEVKKQGASICTMHQIASVYPTAY
jgi:hypothetical protein